MLEDRRAGDRLGIGDPGIGEAARQQAGRAHAHQRAEQSDADGGAALARGIDDGRDHARAFARGVGHRRRIAAGHRQRVAEASQGKQQANGQIGCRWTRPAHAEHGDAEGGIARGHHRRQAKARAKPADQRRHQHLQDEDRRHAQAGLRRRPALRLLQEHRKEEDAAVGGKAEAEGGDVGDSETHVAEQAEWQHRLRRAHLEDEECYEPNDAEDQCRQGPAVAPAVFARRDQPEGQRAQPHDAEGKADEVEMRVLGMRCLVDRECAEHERRQPDRQVDQENALPARHLHQYAADDRADQQRDAGEGRPATNDAGALAGIRESLREDRQRARNEQRPSNALHHPPGEQHRQIGREGADCRAQDEDADPGQPGTLAAIAVADQAGGQHEGRQAQRVGVDHPLQAAEIDAQRLLHGRQRDIDDADVEQRDERAEIDSGDEG